MAISCAKGGKHLSVTRRRKAPPLEEGGVGISFASVLFNIEDEVNVETLTLAGSALLHSLFVVGIKFDVGAKTAAEEVKRVPASEGVDAATERNWLICWSELAELINAAASTSATPEVEKFGDKLWCCKIEDVPKDWPSIKSISFLMFNAFAEGEGVDGLNKSDCCCCKNDEFVKLVLESDNFGEICWAILSFARVLNVEF